MRYCRIGANPTEGFGLASYISESNHTGSPALQDSREALKSILRWAGSKAQLLPILNERWEQHRERRYVEPFCGSASLFFSVTPGSALLSDLNGELISTWQELQRGCEAILECLYRIPLGERAYYALRKRKPSEMAPAEAAARFIYLNRFCFNGLYRTNRAGDFNVPYGSKHTRLEFDAEQLRQCSQLLQHAQVVQSDFEAIVDRTSSADFLYLDPPYVTGEQRIFKAYGKDQFAPSDLERLFKALDRADARGVRFLLSYANVLEARPFVDRWPSCLVRARRNIAGFAGARRHVDELLVTNF